MFSRRSPGGAGGIRVSMRPQRRLQPLHHLPPPQRLAADRAGALEDLLDTVWRCEREWALDDRICRGAAGASPGHVSGPPRRPL